MVSVPLLSPSLVGKSFQAMLQPPAQGEVCVGLGFNSELGS